MSPNRMGTHPGLLGLVCLANNYGPRRSFPLHSFHTPQTFSVLPTAFQNSGGTWPAFLRQRASCCRQIPVPSVSRGEASDLESTLGNLLSLACYLFQSSFGLRGISSAPLNSVKSVHFMQ
jgi:hypothetical protein